MCENWVRKSANLDEPSWADQISAHTYTCGPTYVMQVEGQTVPSLIQ